MNPPGSEEPFPHAAVLQAAGVPVVATDPAGTIICWNYAAEERLGWPASDAAGSHYTRVFDNPGQAEPVRAALAGGRSYRGPLTVRHRDGRRLSLHAAVDPCFGAGGADGSRAGRELLAVVCVLADLPGGEGAMPLAAPDASRRRTAAEQERHRLGTAQELAHIGFLELDLDSGRSWWSDEFCRIHGLPAGPAADLAGWLRSVQAEDRDRVRQSWQQLVQGRPPQDFTYRVQRQGTAAGWVQARASLVPAGAGVPPTAVLAALDITWRKQCEAALERLAFRDPLTGLANRALLTERLQQAVGEAGSGRPLHVFFLDVDRLRVINDGMGHAAGDSLLAQLADRLHHQVRREDTVARFAGDEFVIVCQDLTPADADQLADRIRAIVQAPFELMQREVFVGTSVGIACYRDGATAESLLHDADAAMYRAKEGGRRAAVLFDGRMHQEAEARLDLEAELNRAVERGELRIHYQPILDIKSRRPAGFEALLRWQHPRYGLLAPDRFIPLAEETGLIVPIGSWVLGEALRQAGNWRHTIPGAAGWRIAVNLSARQLQDPGLYAGVAEAIAASGVAPAAVELEITESVLMKDVDRSLETLTRLRGLGVGLAVDDFGTGYSSLGYLRRFPVTTLKIDRSFIDGLDGTDAGAGNIVEWITGLADALRLNVVAEGVETPAQLHELDRLNAQLAQGFLWAEPLPAAEVAGWHAALLPGKAAGGR